MNLMHFGVITFPGSNCDHDMIDALGRILAQEVSPIWHKEHDLKGVDAIVLPGGFSYGDYLRSGAIARFSPVMQEVIEFANSGGLVLGVCNGFQILCESGLLPGALIANTSHRFICKNIELKVDSLDSPITSHLDKNRSYTIPIAHGEGRFFADSKTLDDLEANGQVLFHYANDSGEVSELSNPNGSSRNIAGICNAQRNVMGMMPHPERAVDPALDNEDGSFMLRSLIHQFESNKSAV
jgi:phosphoribosylformylglycinamidine synthase